MPPKPKQTPTDGAKEIFLTTQQMAFIVFNLFGHDIIHDAHPALGSGSDRTTVVASKLTRDKLTTLSSDLSVGGKKKQIGGNDDVDDDDVMDDYNAVNDIISDESREKNKKPQESVRAIVTSVGDLLVKREMLYVVEYKKIDKDTGTLSFKDYQEKTFIIIDLNRIVHYYGKKDQVDPTYPGDIFYKGNKIPFWKISTNKTRDKSVNKMVVTWNFDNVDYTLSFIHDSKNSGKYSVLNIRENDGKETQFIVLCTAEQTTSNTVCSSIDNYITNLGDDFFYNTFMSFMKNETYYSIEGLFSLFPDYIMNKKESDFKKNFDEFIRIIENIPYDNVNVAVETLFNSYNTFYTSFLGPMKDFYDKMYIVMTKLKYFYPNWIDSENFNLPTSINEETSELKIREIYQKYIIVLVKIFAAYFNKYKGPISKINNILELYSCNPQLFYVKEFFKMTSLYFNSKDSQLGGKKINQFGGAHNDDIMTTDQKDLLVDKTKSQKDKYESIMENMIPYEGVLDTEVINAYFNEMIPSSQLVSKVITTLINVITQAETSATAAETAIPLLGLSSAAATPTKVIQLKNLLTSSANIKSSVDALKAYLPTSSPPIKSIVITPAVTIAITELAKSSDQLTSNVSKLTLASAALTINMTTVEPLKKVFDAAIAELNETKTTITTLGTDLATLPQVTATALTAVDTQLLTLNNIRGTGIIGAMIIKLENITIELKNERMLLISKVNKQTSKPKKTAELQNLLPSITSKIREFTLIVLDTQPITQAKTDNLALATEAATDIIPILPLVKTAIDKLITALTTTTTITTTTPIFENKNILNLILTDFFYKSIKYSDVRQNILISSASNSWMLLFNISNFLSTHKYLGGLNNLISNTSATLDSITKMPANDNENIKSLFKYDCSSIGEIDKNKNLKLLSLETKELLVQLYNFEQAFIIQLKVFLLYKYIILYPKKGESVPSVSSTAISFWTNFKKNFLLYYKIIQLIININVNKISQIQKVNTAYMISSSTGVISYCIKKIPPSKINRITDTHLDNEMSILETIYLTTNLKEGSSVGDPDDKLIQHFKRIINTLSFEGQSSYTISNSNSVKGSTASIMGSINNIPKKQGLYLINNAINTTGIDDFFCPYSSILDGQSTCKSYKSALDKGNPIEEGETNVLLRDGFDGPETMRYHVRVKKSKNSSDWVGNKKIVEISAYLKIGDKVLINIGWGDDVPTYNHSDYGSIEPVLSVNLMSEANTKSPFDAKECIENIIDNNIKLLTNPNDSLKTWDDFLGIINSDGGDVDTKGYGTISRDTFRRKIIQTSFVKSLGDYLQEINTVADNGGYKTTPTSTNANSNNVLIPPNTFRLGLSNDRPSGVRIATFLLFGLSGINPNAVGGYYTISEKAGRWTGNYMIAARNKSNLKKSGQTISGGSSINKINNNTKRRKNITKKRKILFKKNKKISKRNNKVTKKRK